MKGFNTLLAITAIVMLGYNVSQYRQLIKMRTLNMVLYCVMILTLCVNLLSVWLDTEFFCDKDVFKAVDEIMLSNEFV